MVGLEEERREEKRREESERRVRVNVGLDRGRGKSRGNKVKEERLL